MLGGSAVSAERRVDKTSARRGVGRDSHSLRQINKSKQGFLGGAGNGVAHRCHFCGIKPSRGRKSRFCGIAIHGSAPAYPGAIKRGESCLRPANSREKSGDIPRRSTGIGRRTAERRRRGERAGWRIQRRRRRDAEAIEEVVVTGFRASLNAALADKREAAGAIDSIRAEDIAKFPGLQSRRIPAARARRGDHA